MVVKIKHIMLTNLMGVLSTRFSLFGAGNEEQRKY